MTNLVRWLSSRQTEVRDSLVSIDEWASWFNFNGLSYPVMPTTTYGTSKTEEIASSFPGYVEGAYKNNGVVFTCMLVRMLLFSEARFQFRQLRNGRPGDLFGTADLNVLERPWVNGTTGDLLSRMIQDVDLSGNFYATRKGNVIQRMRPDWVTIIMGSNTDPDNANWQLDSEVVGYVYHPGGRASDSDPVVLLANEVAHWAPIPDPIARFRGMSWLTPVLREILSDGAATTHKLKFFENGATPNMVVSLQADISPETFAKWIEMFEEAHGEGLASAYKTMYLGGGADVQVVGADMQQMDFKVTQGAGETRIAAAAGVPPVIAGFSEGLSSATYSNYAQARRRFSDGTMRPLWRSAAAALAVLLSVPGGAELWYDDRDIPFLAEDVKDEAEVQQARAVTLRELINAGFEPRSAVDAVQANDMSRLVHTGLVSVQLQVPGSTPAGPPAPVKPPATKNGKPVKGQLPPIKKSP